ncbi:hypothetical protein DIPPA_29076 [Diplonema papillatum]|nr:hypothetical protein DIPPA_29076 [Diplonema papillatum]
MAGVILRAVGVTETPEAADQAFVELGHLVVERLEVLEVGVREGWVKAEAMERVFPTCGK